MLTFQKCVTNLIEPLVVNGHAGHMETYYTSPELVAELMSAGTGVARMVGPTEKKNTFIPRIKSFQMA